MSEGNGGRASFGDVMGEYLALRRGAGLVAGARDMFWVRGADAVGFLDGQLSQDVAAMAAGDVARSFLLEPRGKIVALFWVLRGVDEVGLIADAGRGAVAAAALARFRLRVAAEVGPVERIDELWGPEAAAVLVASSLEAPSGWVASGDAVVASIPAGIPRYAVAGVGHDVLVEAGATPVGRVAATTARIEIGEPMVGVDIDESTIPQESGLVAEAVSFTKGCFLGQELVARIDSRGRVNRHLRGIVVTENLIPPEGAEVVAEGVVVGSVTSVGESPTVGAPVALGLIRREVEPGAAVELVWEGGRAGAIVRRLPLV